MLKRSGQQLPTELKLYRCLTTKIGICSTTGPHLSQFVGQRYPAAILEVDAVEARKQWNRLWLCGKRLFDGGIERLFKHLCGWLTESLFNGLTSD